MPLSYLHGAASIMELHETDSHSTCSRESSSLASSSGSMLKRTKQQQGGHFDRVVEEEQEEKDVCPLRMSARANSQKALSILVPFSPVVKEAEMLF